MGNSNFNSLAVYKKSLVLRDLSNALGHYFSGDSGILSKKTMGLRTIIAQSLVTDASLIPLTIEAAYQTDSLHIRLKNASFINIITKNILSYLNGLEYDGVKEKEYLQLLRMEIKTFRRSFKQWRKSLASND